MEIHRFVAISLPVATDRYWRYYFGQRSSDGVGPEYKASFRVQSVYDTGLIFKGLFRFVKPLMCSGVKTVGKEAFRIGANILSDIV
jgi:hypothetical protein